MTDENRKANIAAEWSRAQSSLRSARILRDAYAASGGSGPIARRRTTASSPSV